MAEENPEKVPNPGRREFLKRAGRFIAGAATLTVAGTLLKEPRASRPVPKELPPDTLTDEQLRQANIKVYDTPTIKLHLREGIFDFPVFADAKGQRLKGVTITLADHSTISWAISNHFPEDAKNAWQLVFKNPIEEWKKGQRERGLLDSNPPQLVKDDYYDSIYRGAHLDTRYLIHEYPEFFLQHPELKDRVFLYLAVGDSQKPHPEESYLDPEDIKKHELPEKERDAWAKDFGWEPGTFYRFLDANQPSFVLRHELSHYGGQKIDPNPELVADTLAFNSLVDAWEKLNHSGDISGYPFVFETDEGLTFTRRENPPPKEGTSVRQT